MSHQGTGLENCMQRELSTCRSEQSSSQATCGTAPLHHLLSILYHHCLFCKPVPCVPSVTCCQRLQIPSVKTASAVTLTAHFSDVSFLHTGSDHEGRTPRSSRFSSAFSFFFCFFFSCKVLYTNPWPQFNGPNENMIHV